jgi:hypothetical protein
MKATELAAEEEQIRVTSIMAGLYFSSVDWRSSWSSATTNCDPVDNRGYVYPIWENVRRYVLHVRARREAAHVVFLEEKSRTQRAARQRLELELAVGGALVAESYSFGLHAEI